MQYGQKSEHLYNKKVKSLENLYKGMNDKLAAGMTYPQIEAHPDYNRALDKLLFDERAFNNFQRFRIGKGDDEEMDRDFNPMDWLDR